MINQITLGYIECDEDELRKAVKAIHFDDELMAITIRNSKLSSTGKDRHIFELSYSTSAEYKKVIKRIGLVYAELSKYITSSNTIDADDFELRPLQECINAADTSDAHKIIASDPLVAY